jgi:hypothetical protein
MIKIRLSLGFALASMTALVVAGCSSSPAPVRTAPWPTTGLHFPANGNFGPGGQYLPGADGFNLADVNTYSKDEMDSLPAGVRGLVSLGDCTGATASFRSAVDAYAGDAKLFGFYVMDEPSPSTCPPGHLLAEDRWIHAHVPGAVTFAVLENLGSQLNPTFRGSYTPKNSGLDLIGLDPYPVRSELSSPDYAEISQYVHLAEAVGWPRASIVPVYQAFGGGDYLDNENGSYLLPTAAQERQLLADWAVVVPDPKFDYAYSWGQQKGDMSLSQSSALRALFTERNK